MTFDRISLQSPGSAHGLSAPLDLNPDSLRGSSREEAASKMEGVFVSLLVKEMRSTLPKGLFGDGPGAGVYEGLFDSMLSDALASGRGIGLRQAILDSLPASEEASPSDASGASDKEEAPRAVALAPIPSREKRR